MSEEIFTVYNKKDDKYCGKSKTNKNLKYIKGTNNLKYFQKYYIFGEYIDEETLNVTECYEYVEFIGKVIDLKSQKNKKNIATIKTEDGKILKANITNLFTEINEPHIIKGYFRTKKTLEITFIKKLIDIEVRVEENLKETNTYNNWLKAQINEKDTLSAKKEKIYLIGNFSLIYKKDIINVYGYKDGRKFYVLSYRKDIENNLDMLKTYISNIFRGVLSTNLITKLIKTYGIDTIKYFELEEHKEKLLEDFKQIDEEKYDVLNKRVIASKYLQDFFYFCEKEGISVDVANYIYKEYGGGSLDKLKLNPYLITDAKSELFEEADIIAKKFNWEVDSLERIKAGIKYFLTMENESKGDVFTYKDDLLNNINPFLNKFDVYDEFFIDKKYIEEALKDLESSETIKIIDNDKIYFMYNYVYEKEAARMLKKLINDYKTPFCKKIDINTAISNFNTNYVKLDKKQELAIEKALTNNISILTGGPGTGKTLTVNAILKTILLINPKVNIRLCAPTGRASKRMMEVTNYKSSTIHKLLNLNAFSTLTKDDDIPAQMQNLDFLIIDEFSMVDTKLFYEILICLDEKTRVIIIGDHHQLAPVGPGQILKDLINSGLIETTELTEIFRQAGKSNIVKISHQMIKKEKIILEDYKVVDDEDILTNDFLFLETNSTQRTIEKIFDVLDLLKENGNSFNNIQLLSPMNKGDLGTTTINNDIQKYYNDSSEEYIINPFLKILKGDKVIQTKNNYDLDVMNGSIGYVENIYFASDNPKLKEDEISIDFDDEDVSYKSKDLEDLKLAYNITIHKSQGSEFPIVILPLDLTQKSMLNINLLYTAITRAKSKVIIIGSKEAFYIALNTLENNRNTNLINFLEQK